MKRIKYSFGGNPVEMPWNEANEAIAKREANGGAYTIDDDGSEETAQPLSTEERLEEMEQAVKNIPALIASAIKAVLTGTNT